MAGADHIYIYIYVYMYTCIYISNARCCLQDDGSCWEGLSKAAKRADTTARFVIGLILGPPVVPLYPCLGEGSPTKIDYRKKGTLILTSVLEDLG